MPGQHGVPTIPQCTQLPPEQNVPLLEHAGIPLDGGQHA
jgi:hypothetical protein